MNTLLSFFVVLLPLTLLDALWIGVIARGFYADRMGFLFQTSLNYVPALFFYPLYAWAILVLAVEPALAEASVWEAWKRGAVLGLAAYAAYDLTNQATIAGWPTSMTIVDIGWGVLVTAATSTLAYFILHSLQH